MDEHTKAKDQAKDDVIASFEKRLAKLEVKKGRLASENTTLRRLYERAPLGYQSQHCSCPATPPTLSPTMGCWMRA